MKDNTGTYLILALGFVLLVFVFTSQTSGDNYADIREDINALQNEIEGIRTDLWHVDDRQGTLIREVDRISPRVDELLRRVDDLEGYSF